MARFRLPSTARQNDPRFRFSTNVSEGIITDLVKLLDVPQFHPVAKVNYYWD